MVTASVPRVKDRELTVTAPGWGPKGRDHGLLSGLDARLPTATGVTDPNAAGITNAVRPTPPHSLPGGRPVRDTRAVQWHFARQL